MSRFEHIVNTSYIAKKYIRNSVSSAITLIKLSDFGIDKDSFISNLAPSYHELPYDYYDVAFKIEKHIQETYPTLYSQHEDKWHNYWKGIGKREDEKTSLINFWKDIIKDDELIRIISNFPPFRKRSCFQYLVTPTSTPFEWKITEKGVPIFNQNVQDARARERKFSAPQTSVLRNEDILKLIASLVQMIAISPTVNTKRFKVTLHQMITYDKGTEANQPAPESIHQDGSHYIVSALVMERKNIEGGISKIYYNYPQEHNKDVSLAFEHTLTEGEGILQTDTLHNLWHEITPISTTNPKQTAYRSTLGFDIDFI